METSEQETIIVVNQADIRDGYFRFNTTRRKDFERLCKRVGGKENLLATSEGKDKDGSVTSWRCKVPARFWKAAAFGIGIKRVSKGNPAALQAALAARKARQAQNEPG